VHELALFTRLAVCSVCTIYCTKGSVFISTPHSAPETGFQTFTTSFFCSKCGISWISVHCNKGLFWRFGYTYCLHLQGGWM